MLTIKKVFSCPDCSKAFVSVVQNPEDIRLPVALWAETAKVRRYATVGIAGWFGSEDNPMLSSAFLIA
jgi:hypothetical protein